MQTVKILTKIIGGNAPEYEKNFVELHEANSIEYRWYKLNRSEYDLFIKEHDGIYAPLDYETYFKRRSDAGMADEINFCYLYFYNVVTEKYIQFALIDQTVFIMNTNGQTIDKIYS